MTEMAKVTMATTVVWSSYGAQFMLEAQSKSFDLNVKAIRLTLCEEMESITYNNYIKDKTGGFCEVHPGAHNC